MDNISLLELIHELYIQRIEITCEWNKKSIINFIKERDININEALTFEKYKWEYYCKNHYINCLYIYDVDFEFCEDDIIKLEDETICKIIIENINNNIYIYLNDKKMNVDEFINIINNKDITIIKNIDKCYFDRNIGNI